MRIALLTYSTKPRGGVVHTLDLAEALAASGSRRHGLVAGARRATAASSARSTRGSRSPRRLSRRRRGVGHDRIVRSIALLRRAFTARRLRHRARAGLHQRQRRRPVHPHHPPPRRLHHAGAGRLPREGRSSSPTRASACRRRSPPRCATAGGSRPTVIPNGVRAQRFADAASDGGAVGRDGWQQLGRYVLAVGGIEPRKGTIDLVEAYRLLRQRLPDVAPGDRRRRDAVRLPRLPRRLRRGAPNSVSRRSSSARSRTTNCPPWSPPARRSPSRRPRRASGWPRWRRSPPGVPS